MKLPPPPPEIPASNDLTLIAPTFAGKVFELLAALKHAGHDPIVFEAFRSDERQAYLFGFGRSYDDDRGIVTHAATGRASYHRYGLAVDIISKSTQWDAPPAFWTALRTTAESIGLTSGASWTHPDRPHVQWKTIGMPVTPTDDDWDVLMTGGPSAVWRKYHADWMPQAA